MQPIYLFDLAARRTSWLAAREAAVAGNIANANTPGYHAKDVASFQDVLAKTQLSLAATSPSHIGVGSSSDLDANEAAASDSDVEITENGNTVGMEQELVKSGEINRDYSLTTNVTKTFHNMLMACLRGGS